MLYKWLIFLHVLGAFVFLFGHGASGLVAFRLRSERNLERIQALLTLYSTQAAWSITYGSLLLMLVTGIITGFQGHWWSMGWIWAALILLIALIVTMYIIGTNYYTQVRKAVGLEYMEGSKSQPAVEPASAEEIDVLLNRSPAMSLTLIGIVGSAIILWLMMFKPF